MTTAMYAFSGDPITFGHIDIIQRAAKAFETVVVGIGVNPEKKYTFTLEERTNMAIRALVKIPNAKVCSFTGLLVDYAYENNIPAIVKGVRNSADFDYENVLHQVGESQKLGIDTFILFAKPHLAHISSSAAKAVQKEQGAIHEYVPLYVKQCLESRISGQYIIGITGEIGVGKSFLAKKFSSLATERGITVNNIDLDTIAHDILGNLQEPAYKEVREKLIQEFGTDIRSDNGINRKVLGEIVFNDPAQLKKVNNIMYTPLMVRLRRALYGKKGLIILDAALIVETGLGYLCNNNIVLVTADKTSQHRRLRERNLVNDQIARRLSSQYNFEEKLNKIEESIETSGNGHVWTIENSDSSDGKQMVTLFDSVISALNVTK